jgi:hypothetical protein
MEKNVLNVGGTIGLTFATLCTGPLLPGDVSKTYCYEPREVWCERHLEEGQNSQHKPLRVSETVEVGSAGAINVGTLLQTYLPTIKI